MDDYEELYNYARDNGLEATKELLRKYVEDGQPKDFMPEYTSRAMCRCAAHGLSGDDIDDNPDSYIDTEHGPTLYWHMWGGNLNG